MTKNLTILLIDDDADDRQLFAESLKEVDDTATLVSTASGKEALLYLKDEQHNVPDYIFLDLRMPGLSGQQCLVEIKKDARLSATHVIIYTTSREVSDSVKLKNQGATHFMSKPTSPEEVYYMISFVLGEQW